MRNKLKVNIREIILKIMINDNIIFYSSSKYDHHTVYTQK